MTLDPAGLEAAAKLARSCTPTAREDARLAEQIVRAYLAAAPDTGRSVLMHVPVTPTTENPYRGQPLYLEKCVVWDEGWAAGRAAATETIPREDALQALHEMSTVAGLLRVRRDDPAVVALGDRLRLACRALRDVTAPGMNELMDSQPGRAAATPTPSDEEGWSPGIDDPEPRALGDIDTGEGWYQT